jgi:hypothetical protein
MKIITAFKTVDGSLFELKEAAEKHEKAHLLRNRISEWVNDYMWSDAEREDVIKKLSVMPRVWKRH